MQKKLAAMLTCVLQRRNTKLEPSIHGVANDGSWKMEVVLYSYCVFVPSCGLAYRDRYNMYLYTFRLSCQKYTRACGFKRFGLGFPRSGLPTPPRHECGRFSRDASPVSQAIAVSGFFWMRRSFRAGLALSPETPLSVSCLYISVMAISDRSFSKGKAVKRRSAGRAQPCRTVPAALWACRVVCLALVGLGCVVLVRCGLRGALLLVLLHMWWLVLVAGVVRSGSPRVSVFLKKNYTRRKEPQRCNWNWAHLCAASRTATHTQAP